MSNKLKEIRESKNVTQMEIAEACQVNQALISRIENGIQPPTYNIMKKACEILNVTLDEIWGDSNDSQKRD